MDGQICRDVILEQRVRLLRDAMGAELEFMDDNTHPLRENIVNECLQTKNITRMDRQVFSPDLNVVEHVWADELQSAKHLLLLYRNFAYHCLMSGDEVEKVAYQLNEEAERTERPIRRLSKVMYGSTCADMQVDVMGECLSSIKHVVGKKQAGEIARHTTQATGRPISRFTVARRLHGGGLFARRPVRCVPLTHAHRRRRSPWCREHQNWRDNEWGRVLFTEDSRFSLSSDTHRILIWGER
ncbi:transposable element Tc3 transposase [Trichonephila clavipes]|nr:transposable element Tc3 transposase [Trichonephila clavipes]